MTSSRGLARRVLLNALIVLGVLALTPALAQASHLRGGYFTAQITTADHLVGAINYTVRNASLNPTCTVGATPTPIGWMLNAPDGTMVSESTNAPAAQCLANAWTYTGTFDINLATTFGSHDTNGVFKLVFGLCCRVAGIVNMSSSSSDSLAFETGIQRVAGTATSAPDISSNAALGIPIGYPYSQNLNVSDPNGSLTYSSLAGTGANYPTSDVVAFSNAGQVTIPASVTSGMTDGDYYVYGVQVTDPNGNYAQREVTMTATAVTSTPPAFSGLPSTVTLQAGTTQVINFSASSSVSHALSISTSALPSWISFSTVPGSPATGTLTISPPANLVVQTIGLNVDAIDNTGVVPVDTSANLQVNVTVPGPTTSIDSQPVALDNSNTPVFTFSSPTGVSFQCNLDSGGWNACASPDQLSALSDGSHTFSVRAVDSSNQVDPNPPSYTWTVDAHTPLAPGLTSEPSDPTNQASASIGLTGETGATFTCTFDSATPVACSSPFTASGLADGIHTLSVTQTDPAGTTSPPALDTWTVDTHTPLAPGLTSEPSDPTNQTSASIGLTGETGATFTCTFDGGTPAACSSPFTASGLADGAHTLAVTQTDLAGTTGPAVSDTWTVDTHTPVAPGLTGQPSDPTNQTSASIGITGETGATFTCTFDSAIPVACSSPFTASGLADGAHTLSVTQTDPAGTTSAPAVNSWTVDTHTPAAPGLSGQPSDPTNQTSASIGITGEGGATFTCTFDGGTEAACSSPFTASGLADGAHTLAVTQTDLAGTTGPAVSYTWTVDTHTPLAPGLTGQPHDPTNQTSASIGITGEIGATFTCTFDTGTPAPCSSPFTASGLVDGDHTLAVTQTDLAGTTGPAVSYTWAVDAHGPGAPGLSGEPSDLTSQTSASIGITGEIGATFTCTFDAGTPVACSSPFTVEGLADGAHTLSVTQTDPAGTTSPAVSHTWTVDSHTPAAPTITAQPAQHSSTSSFSFTGEHGSSFSCKIDGGSYLPCASPFAPTGLADGPHTFSVTQTDPTGTTSSASSATWALDTTPPTPPLIIGGPVGDTPNSTATYTFTGEDGATFSCRLDGGPWVSCSPGEPYYGLSIGTHRFEVSQTDLAGNTSSPAIADFKVGSTDPLAPTTASDVVATDVQTTPAGFAVGCRLDHGSLQSCTVRGYVVVPAGRGHHKLVLIGSGTTTVSTPGGVRQSVQLNLNAMGRRLLGQSLGGVHVVIRSSATAFGSKRAFAAHTRTKIHPDKRFLEPTDGMFNSNSVVPLARARVFLSYLTTHLSDVKRIHCIGDTDNLGSAASNYRLGLARARAVCAILRNSTQLRGSRFISSSFGETRPRATNHTASGRALNRHVEIIVTFRPTSRLAP